VSLVVAPIDRECSGSGTTLRIGTAGWALPRQWRDEFGSGAGNLERYATRFDAVEINSSSYRPHGRTTYERWAASVPPQFRFAVKLPRAITHDQRLVAADVLLDVFLDEVRGLGDRLGPLLVQLPPSLAFNAADADEFFVTMRSRHAGDIVCEPRHASWCEPPADALFLEHRVARAAADPAPSPAAAVPGGDRRLAYLRLHGSPRMYYSDYSADYLADLAATLCAWEGVSRWCMFDNTTRGAATGNALDLVRLVS